jgi:regulator of protease activity HflC (stomatin/prohibitin superfamily)
MSQFVGGIVLMLIAAAIVVATRASKTKLSRSPLAAVAPRLGLLAGLAAFLLGVFLFASSFVRVIPANNIGVPTTFGKVGSPLKSGLHLTAPWTEITNFSTRVQELSMLRAGDEGDLKKDDSVAVIAAGGGSMAVDVTIRFALKPDNAAELFRQAGSVTLVKDRFVRPDAREVVRDVFGLYTAEEGYSSKRAEISNKIADSLRTRLDLRGITLDSVNVRDVAPDAQQLAAINAILQSRNEAAKALEDQKKQTTEAETRKQVATLDKEASVTKAEAEAQAAVIAATAKAQSVEISAKAEAEANTKIAASLTPALIDLEKTKACAEAIGKTQAQVVNVCAGDSSGGGAGNATSVIVDSRK